MMPSTFQLSFCSSSQPICNHKLFQYYPQVRSQSFKDRANIVDGNLNILRDRIEELKRKETRSLTCSTSTTATQQLLKREWCYGAGYDHRYKRDAMFSQSIELMALASGACGLVFLTGSFSICLVSLLLHLFQH
ncbi:uncharacterized protein LOC121254045 [Juglans microcarpa x Juglans regia]|uniref:uncharacterized protein LOC121254045 n=1 Tax=Juglans microcarpa x Juglans regia TaxID=2249226 RepID=UPI001B7F134E|nr:uncharacterized protein LOC121254045 [Juglans microcarpa x Juglans regia]